MKTFLIASGALLLASAAPAFAQDTAPTTDTSSASVPFQAPSPTSTFTGPRAEIFGGYDRVGTRFRTSDATGSDTVRSHKGGGTAGALLGYDMPIGDTLVAGVFGSYALSTTRSCNDGGGCLKSGREIEGGARLGARVLDGKALAYVKGAYVNGRIRDTALDVADNRNGWRAGAGLEYALNQHAYVKAEYDYTRFSAYKFDIGTTTNSLRFDQNQALAGFGVRF